MVGKRVAEQSRKKQHQAVGEKPLRLASTHSHRRLVLSIVMTVMSWQTNRSALVDHVWLEGTLGVGRVLILPQGCMAD